MENKRGWKLIEWIAWLIPFIETNLFQQSAAKLIGMEAGELRLPLVEMEEKNKEILIKELLNMGFSIREGQYD